MKTNNYSTTLIVDLPVSHAFTLINNVPLWWTNDLTGEYSRVGGEFTVRFGDVHVSTQRIIDHAPDERVVWLVTESNLNFIRKKNEWTGTRITFELSSENGRTVIAFTHLGLVPDIECYSSCSRGWDHYVNGSLLQLLATGKGMPG